jgi:hypothetical protein
MRTPSQCAANSAALSFLICFKNAATAFGVTSVSGTQVFRPRYPVHITRYFKGRSLLSSRIVALYQPPPSQPIVLELIACKGHPLCVCLFWYPEVSVEADMQNSFGISYRTIENWTGQPRRRGNFGFARRRPPAMSMALRLLCRGFNLLIRQLCRWPSMPVSGRGAPRAAL